MSERNKVLTDSEISGFKSMSLYWKEVRERENPISLLAREAVGVTGLLGLKILPMIEHYIELLERADQ